MDIHGCFYNDSIDPSYPSQNLITSDGDGTSDRQFPINVDLQSGRTYVLVVTTYSDTVRENFSITAVGPASVDLTSIATSTNRPIKTTSRPMKTTSE
jgi:hypothetical protein